LFRGDTVRAAFSGIVTKASTYYGYGILVVLEHPQNLETYYAHLSKALVKEGDTILYGTPVGLGGRTGRATTDHLHFEIRTNGKTLNSEHFFDFNESLIKSLVLIKTPVSKRTKASAEVVKVREKQEPEQVVVKPVVVERKYHTIKKGDTLFSLSRRYGKTVDELCKLNNLRKSSILVIGRKIRVN
jgi:murein DD-endopeptidase MepM/ murein hydrolase activator NlpD